MVGDGDLESINLQQILSCPPGFVPQDLLTRALRRDKLITNEIAVL